MGEPCVVCGERTCYCCSDCAIDGDGKVYVCVKDGCRTEHEKKHPRTGLFVHAIPKCDHDFTGPEVAIENGSSRSCVKCGLLAITDAMRS